MTLKAVILTGGRSRRFGGVHKPGVAVGGVSVLARAVSAVRALDPAAEVWVAGPLDGLDTAARPTVRRSSNPLPSRARWQVSPRRGPELWRPRGLAAEHCRRTRIHGPRPRRGRALPGPGRPRTIGGRLRSGRTHPPAARTRPASSALVAAWPEQQLRERLQDIGDVENKPVRLLWDGVEPVLAPVSPASTKKSTPRRTTAGSPEAPLPSQS